MHFELSDGWILMALHSAQEDGGATLTNLIGRADVLNHAIPTIAELNGALTRFLQCGMLTIEDDCFTMSPDTFAAVEELCTRRGGLFTLIDRGLKYLNLCGATPVNDDVVQLTDDQYDQAYRAYRKLMRTSQR